MIAEQIQTQNTSYTASAKYYQFSTILEHVIDCLHTIVTDETNPYHPPLAWLTRKQPRAPEEELSIDLHEECSKQKCNHAAGENVPLSSSVRSRLEKYPQQLRQEIVSRTRDGCAPLFLACKNGLTKIVKYLLEICSADIEQRGRFETLENHHVHSVAPIWVAAVSGHLDTVKLLIDRGADVNSISDTGSTPLRSACFLCKDEDGSEEYDNLKEDDFNFGAQPDQVDTGDIYIKIVHLLIENGADPKRPNYNGGTCLINALHNYHLANYLISSGVDVNAADNQSKTALHYAIHQNRVSVTKLLLANGADPFLQTKDGDDALRLSCIGGHEEIFEHLIANYTYDTRRMSDAYKLLGSSILEIHYDLARVRKYWTKSIELLQLCNTRTAQAVALQASHFHGTSHYCDTRRSRAFRGMLEFHNEMLMQSLTVDDLRIQSLLVSERILGPSHRETIQRLLYRGTFYINSLRPIQCLDLWIYALKLRLEHESIFHFESIFAAQAITKLFLDLLSQSQQQQHVRFDDVHEVLQLLIGRIGECERHLSFRPRSCVHEDIYDLLLDMIVKLLLIMRCVQARCDSNCTQAHQLIVDLAKQNPKTTNGSSLLHICTEPNMFEGEVYRSIQMACEIADSNRLPSVNRQLRNVSSSQQHPASPNGPANVSAQIAIETDSSSSSSPLYHLIKDLIEAGLDLDQINKDNLSALQMLCLASGVRVADKAEIIALLVRAGAHVDRRTSNGEQEGRIRQTLRECGVNPFNFVTLKCLAARRVSELRLLFDRTILADNLNESIAIH